MQRRGRASTQPPRPSARRSRRGASLGFPLSPLRIPPFRRNAAAAGGNAPGDDAPSAHEDVPSPKPRLKIETAKKAGERRLLPALPIPSLPRPVLVLIFQYLPLADLASCMRVSREWLFIIETYDDIVWEWRARKEIPEAAFTDLRVFGDLRAARDRLRAFRHAWNPSDISRHSFVRSNGFTAHRQPVAQSTDGARGKIGVSKGAHAWELVWEGPLGTAAVVGIATRHAALHCPGYMPLIGSDDQSWGWNLVTNTLLHNGEVNAQYPPMNNPPKYQVGERVRMILDCDNHQLYFEKDDEFLGLAFADLPPVKLFPAMCAVYGNTEVTMLYLGQPIVG